MFHRETYLSIIFSSQFIQHVEKKAQLSILSYWYGRCYLSPLSLATYEHSLQPGLQSEWIFKSQTLAADHVSRMSVGRYPRTHGKNRGRHFLPFVPRLACHRSGSWLFWIEPRGKRACQAGISEVATGRRRRSMMECPRCRGTMVAETFADMYDDTGARSFPGWRCVTCGEVLDPVIAENRIGHREPLIGRSRKKFGTQLA